MKIIYDDYGGAHSTQVAAAMHLGRLPGDRVASAAELMALPLFDRTTSDYHGCLMFMGKDEYENEVYVLGRGSGNKNIERAIASGLAVAGADQVHLRFFDTLSCVNLWMRIGGFFSRAIDWVWLGRPLVIYGTQRAIPALRKVVARAKQCSAQGAGAPGVIGSDGADLHALARACQEGIVPGITAPSLAGQE